MSKAKAKKGGRRPAPAPATVGQRRRQLRQRRQRALTSMLVEQLNTDDYRLPYPDDPARLMLLVAVTQPGADKYTPWTQRLASLHLKGDNDIAEIVFQLMRKYVLADGKHDDMVGFGLWCGLDVAGYAEQATEEYPAPASWDRLRDDDAAPAE
jgi:hypothetical protein